MGYQYHEVFNICQAKNQDPFTFIKGFLNIINSDLEELRLTVLDSLDVSLNILNKYFKFEIQGELWEIERFSLKEAQHEPEIERYALHLWDVTKGIVGIEQAIVDD